MDGQMRTHVKSAAVAIGLIFLILSAVAAHEVSEAYSDCLAKAGGATFAMQDCIAAELAVQDKRLNAAYAALLTSKLMTEQRRTKLRDVQRKWVAFRDANCAYYDDASLGQAARLAANECVLNLTADRAFELENLRPQ